MCSGRILPSDKLPICSPGTLPWPSHWSGERHFCRKCTILQCSSSCRIIPASAPQTYLIPYTSTKGNLHFHIIPVFLWTHKLQVIIHFLVTNDWICPIYPIFFAWQPIAFIHTLCDLRQLSMGKSDFFCKLLWNTRIEKYIYCFSIKMQV